LWHLKEKQVVCRSWKILQMPKLQRFALFCLGMCLSPVLAQPAQALPGQLTREVSAWIAANPTLQSTVPGGLRVERSSTAAQRFSFQATVVPPGRITFPPNHQRIRTEFFSLYDQVNGVTPERLAETLRVIYGSNIYQDFLQADVVYAYPTQKTVELSRRQNLPLLAAQQGELRLGNRFAYWVEVTATDRDKAYNGRMTIFLPEDLDKLLSELNPSEGISSSN
jgi:hypothetical protein